MDLFLIEGAGKIPKIQSLLGPNFIVMATGGHFRQLREKSGLYGTGIAEDYSVERSFELMPKKFNWKKILDTIKSKQFNRIFIASDPDREGEAIAWHIKSSLPQAEAAKSVRIVFNEISKSAIEKALASPRPIDLNYVHAQFGRQGYDIIFGFRASRHLQNNYELTSNGRVQGVAVKLLGDRALEIKNYKPEFKQQITANIIDNNGAQVELKHWDEDGKVLLFDLDAILPQINGKFLHTKAIVNPKQEQKPPEPYIASTLLADASKALKIKVDGVRQILQDLYEKGLITYPRTDDKNLEPHYWPILLDFLKGLGLETIDTPRTFKVPASAQGAHKALCPVNLALRPSNEQIKALSAEQQTVYKMIYTRTLLQGLPNAHYFTTDYWFTSSGQNFGASDKKYTKLGFLTLVGGDKSVVYNFTNSKIYDGLVEVRQVNINKKPAPFTEASLIKELERLGIGRPSTYATYPETIKQRKYATSASKTNVLSLTPAGNLLYQFNNEKMQDFINYDFTANIEKELDAIADGKIDYKQLLRNYDAKITTVLGATPLTTTSKSERPAAVKSDDVFCDKCQDYRSLRTSRDGSKQFYVCANYEWDASAKVAKGCPASFVGNDNAYNKKGEGAQGGYSQGHSLSDENKANAKPKVNSSAKPIVKSDIFCQQCNDYRQTRTTKTGKTYFVCANYRYDPTTNTESGCAKAWDNGRTIGVQLAEKLQRR